MTKKQNKIPQGFRLSQENIKLLEELETSFGINKTSIVDMILTLIRRDKRILISLISAAITKK
ncbi:MAG: hypothetical protein U9R32_05335 [Bacteroidota bacterium]|nr:hypothetical protein [Bacteroidota bacterium]